MKQTAFIEPHSHLVIGSKESGKTKYIKSRIKYYISQKKEHNLPYRIIVLDFENEYKLPVLDLKDIHTFRNKLVRIDASGLTVNKRTKLFLEVCTNFRKGLLVIENPKKSFLKDNSLIGSFVTNRTHDMDIILSYNNLKINPKLLQNISYVTWLGTLDGVKKYKSILPCSELFEMAMEIHRNQPAKRIKYESMKVKDLLGNKSPIDIDLVNNKIFCSEKQYMNGFYHYLQNLGPHCIDSFEKFERLKNIKKYFGGQKQIPVSNITRQYIPF